jgi:hypothetical protein
MTAQTRDISEDVPNPLDGAIEDDELDELDDEELIDLGRLILDASEDEHDEYVERVLRVNTRKTLAEIDEREIEDKLDAEGNL